MASRILSQDGNVIAADFRPSLDMSVTVEVRSEVLYRDDRVMLTRTMALVGNKPCFAMHFLGDLETGAIINL